VRLAGGRPETPSASTPDVPSLSKGTLVRTCTVYRTSARSLKPEYEQANYNEAALPQFEACVFSDGRTAQRWLTPTGSMVWWDSWTDLCAVHIYAHPDYGTRVEWSDGTAEEL
jgi:hypothetical protein